MYLCPLCGESIKMDASLTARMWRWNGRCGGGEDEGGEPHVPISIEVVANPEDETCPRKPPHRVTPRKVPS